MPGITITVGGKLSSSYGDTLAKAGKMAEQSAARAAANRPRQVLAINRYLDILPPESLMRPRLLAMHSQLTAPPVLSASSIAGEKTGKSFFGGLMKALRGSTSASSQIISVVSNTMSSLGSGMSPAKILMQQGPNFAQAFTLMGVSMKSALASLIPIAGSIAAIIAAPFIYFSRVSGIVDKLSGIKLPELSTSYVSGADRAAESYRKIANAISDARKEMDGATEAARRMHDEINAQFQTQKQIDDLAKQRAISDARGNVSRIAEIEKQYEQLAIQRESKRLDSEKENSVKEKAGLEAELAKTKEEIAKRGFGSDARGSRNMSDLKKQYEAAKSLIEESEKDGGVWDSLKLMGRSGGLGRLLAGDVSGAAYATSKQGIEEDKAKQEDLVKAQLMVQQYIKILDLEKSRNEAIEERNKLTSKGEATGKRIVELENKIKNADKDKDAILTGMQSVAGAKAALSSGVSSGASGQPLTSREQIGAYSGGGQSVTLIDLSRKQHAELGKHTLALQNILAELKEGAL